MSVMKVINERNPAGPVQLDDLPAGTVFMHDGVDYLMVDTSGEGGLDNVAYFYAIDLRDCALNWFHRNTLANRGTVQNAELRIKPCSS